MIRRMLRRHREAKVGRVLARQLHHTFRENGAIFIHVPKAAGSSISLDLFGHQVGHFTALDWFARDPLLTERLFKFAFVREPLDRLHSAWRFLRAGGMNASDAETGGRLAASFDAFVEQLAGDVTLQRWIHFLPQYHFLCAPDTRLLVDFVGRFENMEADFAQVAARLGKDVRLSNRNPSPGAPLAASDRSRKLVRELYELDYQMFGY